MEKVSDYAIIRHNINEHEIKLSDLEEEENRITPKPMVTQDAEWFSGLGLGNFFRPVIILKCLQI